MHPIKEKVCALIVTYGDRFDSLRCAVEAAFASGCSKVLVVDNGSSPETKKGLSELKNENQSGFRYVVLEENTGSAGGFAAGLREYEKNERDCPFIWLLDDDNIADETALARIVEFWNTLPEGKDVCFALASMRKDRPFHSQVLSGEDIVNRHWRMNSVLGFHFVEAVRNLFRRNRLKRKQVRKLETREIYAGPYGGLFFHKNLLPLIGYPNEAFFAYHDDTEYTYRIKARGGCLLMVFDSVIRDRGPSWSMRGRGNIMMQPLGTDELLRLHYGVRNRIYFERNTLVNNRYVYYLNMSAVLCGSLFLSVLFSRKNFLSLLRGVRDGINGKLGRIK